jgi:hypothetical protein
VLRTALSGEDHVYGDVLLVVTRGRQILVVDEADIDGIHWNLGIAAAPYALRTSCSVTGMAPIPFLDQRIARRSFRTK